MREEQQVPHARYGDSRAFDAPPDTSWGKLLALVPHGARVLDVGCAWGAFAAALQEKRSCTVIGVELDPEEAEAARARCHEVHVGDIAAVADRLPRDFDVIVAADVLEHLLDPGAVLRKLSGLLKPGGVLLASVPNVTHASVVLELIRGRFPRSPEGLLDSTHIQFFGEADVLALFHAAGFAARIADRVRIDPRLTEFRSDLSLPDDVLALLGRNPNSDTYQFIVRAIPTGWAQAGDDQAQATPLDASDALAGRLVAEAQELRTSLRSYHGALTAAQAEAKELHARLKEHDRVTAEQNLEIQRLRRSDDARETADTKRWARRIRPIGPLTETESHRLRVLFVTDRADAPYRYRCLHACEQLRESGVAANVSRIEDPDLFQEIPAYSLVVLFRLGWSGRVERLVQACRSSGAAVAFDIDDLIFDPAVESMMPFLRRFGADRLWKYREEFAALRRTLLQADFCLAATPTIARHARQLGKRAIVHPNVLSRAQMAIGRAAAVVRRFVDSSPTFGYLSGSNTHDGDLASVASALVRFLRERPDAKLVICGHAEIPPALTQFGDRLLHLGYQDHRVYPWLMARCTAVLAPIEEINDFSDAKSALKVFEAGILGVPAVASPTVQYEEAILPGVSGFLATREEEWVSSMLALATRGRALTVRRAARRIALEEYSAEAYSHALARQLLGLCGQATASVPRLRRLEMDSGVSAAVRRRVSVARRSVLMSLAPRRIAAQEPPTNKLGAGEIAPSPTAGDPEVSRWLACAQRSGDRLLVADELVGLVLADRSRPIGARPHNAEIEPQTGSSRDTSFRASAGDPFFEIAPWPVGAGRARYLAVEMAARTDSGHAVAQFFWKRMASAQFSETHSVRFPVIADGKMRCYVLELSRDGVDLLPADAQAARFDPLDRPGSFEVATLALLMARPLAGGIHARIGIAGRFLQGQGLEIGALQNPLTLPPEAQVRYVDRLPVAELRRQYPELDGQPLVEPSVLASAEELSIVPSDSEDFVVCNHVLEHMRDPLGALREWLRVLRPGGHLYVSIPDRANPHDRLRDVTPFGHLLEDHGGAGRKGSPIDRATYLEWARSAHAQDMAPAEQDRHAEELIAQDYSIHFHVFDRCLFERVLQWACAHEACNVVELQENPLEGYGEYIAVVRKERPPRRRPVDVVVPVYNARELSRRCAASVLQHGGTDFRLVLIEDASPEPGVADDLRALAAKNERVIALFNETNAGFVGTANRGMREALAAGRDVLLLNSDTEVFPGFLDRLRDAATADHETGIVTPFSNNATIFSLPRFGDNEIPAGHSPRSMSTVVTAVSRRQRPEMPTGVGFCMYIRLEVLQKVGLFDEETFGRGFGEENDLCQRARKQGFKVRLADDVFVWHKGKASFGAGGHELERRNEQLLREKHPDYHALIAEFCRINPLSPLHREIDFHLRRLREGARGAPLFLIHASPFDPSPGGSEHHLVDLVRSLAFPRAVIGYPEGKELVAAEILDGRVELPTFFRFPLGGSAERFSIEHAEVQDVVRRWVDLFGISWAHLHHLMFWPVAVARTLREAGVPYVFTAHDYYSVCPNWNLYDFEAGARCPCPREGERCGAGCLPAFFESLSLATLRREDLGDLRSRHRAAFLDLLSHARAVIAPSSVALTVLQAHLPLARTRTYVIEHGYDAKASRPEDSPGGPIRVAVFGEIAYPLKGASAVIDLVERTKDLPLEWHFLGNVDRFGYAARLRACGLGERLHIHGPYERGAIVSRLADLGIGLAVIFPQWGETFSYTLSEALVSGTPALVSDVGAIADRVRRDGTGIVARDAGEAASVLRRLTSHPEELHSLQQRVRTFVHRSVAASAAEHRAAYRAVGFSLTPDAELRPEWLHEISERAGVAPSPEGGGTRLVESPTPRASIRRRLEPLIQKVKPFVPAPLRKVAKEALRRLEDRPVLLLDPARPASMVGLRRIGRKWRTAIFDASSPDPQLILPVKPFVPSSINELRFRLRRERDGFAFAQLFWSHGPGSGFSEDNSARIELVGKAGEWREYRLRLDSAELRPRWLGGDRIVRMRFDPINLPGRIEVGPLEFHD